MNKTHLIFLTVIVPAFFLFSSCSIDPAADVVITGLWRGTVTSNDYDNDGQVVIFEFFDNETVRIGDPEDSIIYDDANDVTFEWKQTRRYLKITAYLTMYYAEYYYTLSSDGNTLEIILLQRNFFNDTFEEMDCGDRIILQKIDEEVDGDFWDLMSDLSSSN